MKYITLIALILMAFSNAYANKKVYKKVLDKVYGKSTIGCKVCHTKGKKLDLYGKVLKEYQKINGIKKTNKDGIAKALKALENLDVDADGKTNDAEIKAKKNPNK